MDDRPVISDFASGLSASSTDHFACATALRLRRAVQPRTRNYGGIRLFDETIMPAQPAAGQRIREWRLTQRAENKPKSSGHGIEFGSA